MVGEEAILKNSHGQASNKMKKIGLCMIVKDESKVIKRCLDSVKPLIDYVCIVDTGSTDNTIETILSWLNENNILGKVVTEPWKDFAHNRTSALAHIRKQVDMDYVLMIDADETLVYDIDFDADKFKQTMDKDLYMIKCHHDNIVFDRLSITKNEKPFIYKGVLHEYLDCEEPIETRAVLLGVRNTTPHDGARSQVNKFENDVAIFENALLTETDPFLIARYTFYLAQSFRDLNQDAKALKFYLERSTKGFWSEEVFMSLLNAARLKEKLKYKDEDIIQSYMQAHEVAPHRIEALHGAAKFCRTSSKYHQAYILGKWGQSLPVQKDGLFVEAWIWDYGIEDEVSVSAYWSGHYTDGLKITKELLKKIPKKHLERMQQNLVYFESKL
jgi:glycosyltransferase involved in cell wall biosynthesis